MIYHKHLLVNAKVSNPMRDEQVAIDFLNDLVKRIDMNIFEGPFARFIAEDAEGNSGLTAIVLIETSHIAFHIWDQVDPGLLQFDLYTCKDLDLDEVMEALNEGFDIVSMDWVLYDREDGFKIERQGSK
jgi:S-adenosylmethionine/arginine decarboxylase-like enzyme